MGKIEIHANDINKFGGLVILFNQKSKKKLSQTDVILYGNFDSRCMNMLTDYVKENNLAFNSLTFSSDIDFVPVLVSCDFVESIIIPEGIRIIPDYTFCNCQLKKIRIASTVQNIGKRAFINFSVDQIEIENNLFFSKKEKDLIYKLTNEIILQEEKEELPEFLTAINSKENIKLWNSLKDTYKFSIKISDFWKKEYEMTKDKLSEKALPQGCKNLLEGLQISLRQLPDSYGNIQMFPDVDFKYGSFSQMYCEFTEILKSVSGERRALYKSFEKEKGLLIYSSIMLHPGKENLYFVELENGIEFVIPGLYLYLFFPLEEVALIPSFIEYLARNLISLTKKFALMKEKTVLVKPEFISEKDRKAIIKKLSSEEYDKKKIKDFADKRITYLAESHNLKIQIIYERDELLISSNKKDKGEENVDWTFRISAEEILKNPESTLQQLDYEFGRIKSMKI